MLILYKSYRRYKQQKQPDYRDKEFTGWQSIFNKFHQILVSGCRGIQFSSLIYLLH